LVYTGFFSEFSLNMYSVM